MLSGYNHHNLIFLFFLTTFGAFVFASFILFLLGHLGFIQARPPHVLQPMVDTIISPALTQEQEYVNSLFWSSLVGVYGEGGNLLGVGVSVTSDGWIIVSDFIFDQEKADLFIVKHRGSDYEVEQIIPDASYGVRFVKVVAENFHPITFQPFETINVDSRLFVVGHQGTVRPVRVEDTIFVQQENSSEVLPFSISTVDIFDTNDLGSPIVSANGIFVGFVSGIKSITPSDGIESGTRSVISEKRIVRPFFGVEYTNDGLEKGVVIKDFLPKSPARLAGLELGDIITAIDANIITQTNNLTNIIQGYRIGEGVVVTYLRDDKENEVNVFLGILE